MTLKIALSLLAQAPAGEGPSLLNPLLTEAQAVQIIRNVVETFGRSPRRPRRPEDNIDPLMAKKVLKICGMEHLI